MSFFSDVEHDVSHATKEVGDGVAESPAGDVVKQQARQIKDQTAGRGRDGAGEDAADVTEDVADDAVDGAAE